MDLGKTITELRKERDWSREKLGSLVGTSGAVIGRYEREEITPSVEIARKIADALEVSLDYLTGGTSVVLKDKKMIYRLELLEKINKKERETILHVVDSLLQSAQLATTQQKLM
ncbi:MAG: helix-turn-helix transcriptional regulator [Bacteroidota bacterium]